MAVNLNRQAATNWADCYMPNWVPDLAADSTRSSIWRALKKEHHENEALEVKHQNPDLLALYRDPSQHDDDDRL